MSWRAPGPMRLYARYCAVFLLAQVALLFAGTTLWARWSYAGYVHAERGEARRVHAMLGERLMALPEADQAARLPHLQEETGYALRLLPMEGLPAALGEGERARLLRPRGGVALHAGSSYQRLAGSDRILVVDSGREDEQVIDADLSWIGLWLALALAVALPLYFLIHRLWYDIGRLRHAIGLLRANCFDQPVPPMRTALMRPLASALQDMAGQMRLLLDGHRLMGQAMAHELRTPMARIRFSASLLQQARCDLHEHDALLRELDVDIAQLDELTSAGVEYIRFGRMPLVERSDVPLAKMVEAVIAHLRPRAEVVVEWHCAAGLTVHVHAAALELALRNLLANAVRHARQRVVLHAVSKGAQLCICIDDDGRGIPAAERQRVFLPYVRLGTASGGFGLGLAMVKVIVERHEGTVGVADSPLGGARLCVELPL